MNLTHAFSYGQYKLVYNSPTFILRTRNDRVTYLSEPSIGSLPI